MYNFGFQRQRTTGGTILNNELIEFDSHVVDYDSTIIYNNGVFTLESAGDYLVSWFVTIKTGLGTSGPNISLVTNDTPSTIYPATNSIKTGQISGTAIVKSTGSTTFQLINNSKDIIVLASNVPVTASITITQANADKSGIVLQTTTSRGAEIDASGTIPFNLEYTKFNNSITNKSGVINITTPARYIVDWSVSLAGLQDAVSIKFDLINRTDPDSMLVLGTNESPIVTQGTFYGNAILDLSTASKYAPFTLELVNACVDSNNDGVGIILADIPIQASIRIAQL